MASEDAGGAEILSEDIPRNTDITCSLTEDQKTMYRSLQDILMRLRAIPNFVNSGIDLIAENALLRHELSELRKQSHMQRGTSSTPRMDIPDLTLGRGTAEVSELISPLHGASSLDVPAVFVRKKRSTRKEYLTDPSNAISDEPTPIKRRLFESMRILTIDIGATRTKFMYQCGSSGSILTPCDSKEIWFCPEGTSPLQMSRLFRGRLSAHVKNEIESGRLPVACGDLDAVIFAVPGTVDLTPDDMCVVRNMPSMSPRFKGFNFKKGFSELFPCAKIYAVADNMAAAMGVASSDQFNTANAGMVVILGTAPAVATFFRGVSPDPGKVSKTVELAIWQSWVWFTKIPLSDPFGYCGGLRTETDGRTFVLRDKTENKIPHEKSRIRFAIDSDTWKRLRGKLDWLTTDLQGNLTKEEAKIVWSARVQAALNALVLRFHNVYGKPDVVVLLGGNALKCTGNIDSATYTDPDFSRSDPVVVPVYVPESDESQQRIHMKGLAQAANYRISQVYAHGPDPLARGWTRGGEIYLWVKRREVL